MTEPTHEDIRMLLVRMDATACEFEAVLPYASKLLIEASAAIQSLLIRGADGNDLLTTPEAARYIGWGISTLEQSRGSGTGPRYLKMGRTVRYSKCELDRFLKEAVRESTGRSAVAPKLPHLPRATPILEDFDEGYSA